MAAKHCLSCMLYSRKFLFTHQRSIGNEAEEGASFFYNTLIRNVSILTRQQKLSQNLSNNNLPRQKFYLLDKWAVPDSTREFQCRTVRRILPTQVHLKTTEVINDDRCGICKNEQGTQEHFLIHCPISRILWHDIKQSFKK